MAIYHFTGVIQTAKHKLPSPQTAPDERYFCSSESCEGKEPCRGDILFNHCIVQIYLNAAPRELYSFFRLRLQKCRPDGAVNRLNHQ